MDLNKHDFVTSRHECTREKPMPEEREWVGQHWVHLDARPDPMYRGVYRCPNCHLLFRQPSVH